jgi:hypothetical protein
MDIEHGNFALAGKDLGSDKDLPFGIVHPEYAKLETHQNGFVIEPKIEAWHLMYASIKHPFSIKVLFLVLTFERRTAG